MQMQIRCIFVRRGDDEPELFDAWDDYSIEVNPEGYHERLQEAQKTGVVRELLVSLPYGAVEHLYVVPEVLGGV